MCKRSNAREWTKQKYRWDEKKAGSHFECEPSTHIFVVRHAVQCVPITNSKYYSTHGVCSLAPLSHSHADHCLLSLFCGPLRSCVALVYFSSRGKKNYYTNTQPSRVKHVSVVWRRCRLESMCIIWLKPRIFHTKSAGHGIHYDVYSSMYNIPSCRCMYGHWMKALDE